jgi:hypothetical protein
LWQAPQLFGSLNPSMQSPSQESWVASWHPQVPRKHFWSEAHAFPQAPQFASSKSTLVQVPPQSAPPFGQVHTPPWHDFPPVQTMPQPPQLLLSSRRLAQVWPLQHAWLANSQHSLPQASSPSIVSQQRPASLQTPVPPRQALPG